MSDVPIDPIGAARRLDNILSRAALPYTYTDIDGDRIAVFGADIPGEGKGVNVRTDAAGCSVPAGDAVALARAVLAAAGNTGHRVISEDDLLRYVHAGEEEGARSMRERAVECAEDLFPSEAIGEILALPLLPDGDTTEDTDSTVHVATPEGITPCGKGTRDVTTSPLIPEVTCVECLQAIAMEKGGQVIEMRTERDRLRTAWESARRGRAQARETAEMLRFFAGEAEADVIRLRKELRAARDERDQALRTAREVTGHHDPTACTHLACPDCRLAALEDRVAALEERLSPPEKRTEAALERPEPARYRDYAGDLWEQAADAPDRYILTQWRDGAAAEDTGQRRSLKYVRDIYGPLTPVTNETTGGAR